MAVTLTLGEVQRLTRCGKHGCPCATAKGNLHCPAHADPNPSLHVSEKNGQMLYHCFGGCSFEQVRDAFQRLAPSSNGHHPTDTLVKVYQYRDPEGALVAEKGRFESPDGTKRFAWRMPGAEGWPGIAPHKVEDMPLYNTHKLQEFDPNMPVYFVEGEKAADICVEHELLAVSFGGGASTRSFGASLDVLKGRSVLLWPDNDAAGREYMQRAYAALRPVAKHLGYVTLPIALPPKGDAYEFFGLGGTAEQLEASTRPDTPRIEALVDDGLKVTYPTSTGLVIFSFTEIEYQAREMEAELAIESDLGSYGQRINLFSASQRTELRRDLDGMYGKEIGWTKIVNDVFTLARKTYKETDRSTDVLDIAQSPLDQMAVSPLLPLNSPTILFGNGESLKSYTAWALALAFASGKPFLGFATPGLPVLAIDYEDNEDNFRRRLDRLAAGIGIPLQRDKIYYFDPRGMPLADISVAVRKKVLDCGIGLVIVDSVLGACGNPLDVLLVSKYFRHLRQIGVTSLSIAHVTKDADTRYPFGSIHWSNQARRTWYAEKSEELESSEFSVALYCRKVNDGPRPKDVILRARFDDAQGSVKLWRGGFEDAPELEKKRGLAQRIWDVLVKPATVEQIAETLEADGVLVRKTLNNNKGSFIGVPQGPMSGIKGGRPEKWWARKRYETTPESEPF